MHARKLLFNLALAIVALGLAGGLSTVAYLQWRSKPDAKAVDEQDLSSEAVQESVPAARVSPEARKNLGLISKPLTLTTYHRKIEFPAVVADWPGVSDRGVVAPVTGIVTKIEAFPGSYVSPESPLFTLRLASEALHTSQLELFKATKEIDIAKNQKKRLEGLAASGGLAGSRIIEIDNQVERMEVHVQAYRQALLARGLPQASIDAAANGEFVTEIVVRAPAEQKAEPLLKVVSAEPQTGREPFQFEVQSLNVELGEQVDAGQVVCILSDHRKLLLESHGFKKDLALIQKAAKEGLPVEITPDSAEAEGWPALPTDLRLGHVANQIDPVSRTFAFFVPIDNQEQTYMQQGKTRMIWRFRPGDRVQISVRVAEIKQVFIVPHAAVMRDGPEVYLFRQNGDLFERLPVHVVHEDSSSFVVASNPRLLKGAHIAHSAAASLNRVLQAQLASGQPGNMHVHADGSVHAH